MSRGDKAKSGWWKLLILILVIVLVFFIWKWFFSFDECYDWECFRSNLENCNRARYVDGNKMIFEYSILGERGDFCSINVELLQGDLNNKDSSVLEGQEMICKLPKGLVSVPGSDISFCSGQLKEGLQGLVIQRLHTYIVQNLGKINLDILDVPN